MDIDQPDTSTAADHQAPNPKDITMTVLPTDLAPAGSTDWILQDIGAPADHPESLDVQAPVEAASMVRNALLRYVTPCYST